MYTLDTKAAREADTNGASIKELGKYVGEFIQARAIVSKKTQTKGIEFIFKSDAGQKATLSIYTISATGEHYQGYSMVMGIMTCMGLRSIKPALGVATVYDYDQKKDVKEQCEIFTDLCKPIGVLLETEDYKKNNGEMGTRVVLKNVFQAHTELTTTEILDRKTSPEALPKMVGALRHHPIKSKAKNPAQSGYAGESMPPSGHPAAGGIDDDDIPFN